MGEGEEGVLRAQRQHGVDVQRRLTALRAEDEGIYALRFQFCQIAQRAGKNCVLFRHRDDIPVIEARRLIGFHAVNHDGDSTGTIALFRNQHRDFVADLSGITVGALVHRVAHRLVRRFNHLHHFGKVVLVGRRLYISPLGCTAQRAGILCVTFSYAGGGDDLADSPFMNTCPAIVIAFLLLLMLAILHSFQHSSRTGIVPQLVFVKESVGFDLRCAGNGNGAFRAVPDISAIADRRAAVDVFRVHLRIALNDNACSVARASADCSSAVAGNSRHLCIAGNFNGCLSIHSILLSTADATICIDHCIAGYHNILYVTGDSAVTVPRTVRTSADASFGNDRTVVDLDILRAKIAAGTLIIPTTDGGDHVRVAASYGKPLIVIVCRDRQFAIILSAGVVRRIVFLDAGSFACTAKLILALDRDRDVAFAYNINSCRVTFIAPSMFIASRIDDRVFQSQLDLCGRIGYDLNDAIAGPTPPAVILPDV